MEIKAADVMKLRKMTGAGWVIGSLPIVHMDQNGRLLFVRKGLYCSILMMKVQ